MATSTQDVNSNFETNLRDRLIAAQQNGQAPHPHDSAQQPTAPDPYTPDSRRTSGPDGQIDPMIDGPDASQHQSPPNYDMGGMSMDDSMGGMSSQKGGAGRRELSTTKRAAQNRAAQRAFRQRKEAYITKLEKQVQDYRDMEVDFKTLQHENYQLREYILSLQNRILETSSDLPPPPSRVQLGGLGEQSRPPHHDGRIEVDPAVQASAPPPQPAPTASMGVQPQPGTEGMPQAAVEQLQAAAAEADELGDPKVER